jgi:hypothetical protein
MLGMETIGSSPAGSRLRYRGADNRVISAQRVSTRCNIYKQLEFLAEWFRPCFCKIYNQFRS